MTSPAEPDRVEPDQTLKVQYLVGEVARLTEQAAAYWAVAQTSHRDLAAAREEIAGLQQQMTALERERARIVA